MLLLFSVLKNTKYKKYNKIQKQKIKDALKRDNKIFISYLSKAAYMPTNKLTLI